MAKKSALYWAGHRIVEMLEKAIESGDVAPWHKPWSGTGSHMNVVTGNVYRGFNQVACGISALYNEFSSPYWVTMGNVRSKKAFIKKDELKNNTVIVAWIFPTQKQIAKAELDDRPTPRPFARYYKVWNVEQLENLGNIVLPDEEQVDEFLSIDQAESIAKGYVDGPKVTHNEQRAYYSPAKDIINMPKPESFESEEFYYGTLFHEMVHSTGHKSRLARKEICDSIVSFGSKTYCQEELTAEIGAAMILGIAGIVSDSIDKNSVAYLQSWLQPLKDNPAAIVYASQAAQKAVDHIIGNDEE